MKKLIITILIIIIVIVSSILIITAVGTNNVDNNIKRAKTALMINEHVDSINNMDMYYGNKKYYIADYIFDNKEYIGIMNTKYELIKKEEKSKLYKIDGNYEIGYKNDKIIYEVKKKNKDGIVYYYYDALNGELINKIDIDR